MTRTRDNRAEYANSLEYQMRYRLARAEQRRAYQREYYQKNRAASRESNRACARQKGGFSRERFAEMLSAQEWCCAICGGELVEGSKIASQRPHADHDHVSGQPRGILCGRCNRAIGLLGDTADSVSLAHEYLYLVELGIYTPGHGPQ